METESASSTLSSNVNTHSQNAINNQISDSLQTQLPLQETIKTQVTNSFPTNKMGTASRETVLSKTPSNLPKPSIGPLKPLPALKPLSSLKQATSNNTPPSTLPDGSPNFEKPRSAAIYSKLCSDSVDVQKSGMKDVAFVMGQDQMILLAKAILLKDESIRIEATKILSRKRTPEAREMLKQLVKDSNETVASLAKKTFQLIR